MIGCWEGEVHYCCLKSYGIFYCSNVWWDHVPDANCTGVNGEHCSVDAAPGGIYIYIYIYCIHTPSLTSDPSARLTTQ